MKAALLGAAAALFAAVAPAGAETLAEAIAYAYETNPTLLSQRAQLQSVDENYVQARVGFRPQASAQATASYVKSPQLLGFGDVRPTTETNTAAAILGVSQPIYTGGRTTAAVRLAEAQIRASREQLRGVEEMVIQAVVQAYADVQRDRLSLKIQRDGLKELTDETDEIRARYEAGVNTVTDVSQAQTQVEAARAQVESAQAQLEVSNAEYVNDVGRSPGDLAPFPDLPNLPKDLDAAFDAADHESPTLRQAQFTEVASRAQVQQARAEGNPNLALNGQFGYTGPAVPLAGQTLDRTVSVTATLSKPIFTGGMIQSQVRQATALDTSARVQSEATRRNVVQTVAQAWSQRRAAEQNTVVETAEVKAAQDSFDGMRVEYRAGLRQTLDVLIAQQTLTGAKINLAAAVHDAQVDTAVLLSAVGRLEARSLLQGAPLYDPEVSFRRVEDRGSVPWEIFPEMLDKIGAPKEPQPAPLPEPPSPSGTVRLAPAAPASVAAPIPER